MRTARTSSALLWVAGISVIYLISACLTAASRPFWYDELITWHVSRLPNLAAIWAALRQGVDQEMPLTHLTVRFFHMFFGVGHLSTRLSAILGFWAMILAVYTFLKRRLPMAYALLGMIFPMLTFAWYYASEGRAYGVTLGCEAVALVAWQHAAEDRVRRLSLAVLGFSLAWGLGNHALTGLVAIPLACGELWRTIERRRVDLPVWLAFACGMLSLLLYPGSIHAAQDWDMTGMQPNFSAMAGFYDSAFRITIAPLLLIGVVGCLVARTGRPAPEPGRVFPRHETAAMIACAAAPIVFTLAGFVTSRFSFHPRYGLICVIGVAYGLAVLLFRATAGSYRAGMVMLVMMVGWLGMARAKTAIVEAHDPRAHFLRENVVLADATAAGTPTVSDCYTFMAADFYLPPESARHVYYVTVDRKFAHNYTGQDVIDQLLARAGKNLKLRAQVQDWRSFSQQNPTFLLYLRTDYPSMFDMLLQDRRRLSLTDHRLGAQIFEVSAPAEGAPSTGR